VGQPGLPANVRLGNQGIAPQAPKLEQRVNKMGEFRTERGGTAALQNNFLFISQFDGKRKALA
jgi:hypothetical protein